MYKQRILVDISDAAVSSDPSDVLTTYSLSSCIGVALYDWKNKIGGLIHYQLPESKLDPEKARKCPYMFADTAMAFTLERMRATGAVKKNLKVKIAGGASMNTGPTGFDIGKRNHLAIRKVLWKHGLFIDAQDIGGSSPRNMYLNVEDGSLTIRCVGIEKNL